MENKEITLAQVEQHLAIDPFFDNEPCWLGTKPQATTGKRRVCLKRQSGFVYERDKHGYYTVPVYDPLASVISYLRDEKYIAGHSANVDLIRIYTLIDAIDICNRIANAA